MAQLSRLGHGFPATHRLLKYIGYPFECVSSISAHYNSRSKNPNRLAERISVLPIGSQEPRRLGPANPATCGLDVDIGFTGTVVEVLKLRRSCDDGAIGN